MIYNVERSGYILLGRCGESHARTVEIDVSSYLEEWPDGAVTLLHRRHGEETIYPVASELQGGHLIWAPSSADTAYVGDGEAEVRVTVGGTVVKSKILPTVVEKSLTGQEADTPEASKDWVDKVLEKVGDMTEVKAEAESIEYGQPAKAEYDKETGTLKLSIPEGKPGEQGPQGPQGEPGKDAEVTSENIQSALGYAPVKDIQIAGTSILADGVANVPIAAETNYGVVKVFDWGGTRIDEYKRLCVFQSSSNHIARRESRTVIVPENLDYAVKAAMCDGKGAAWTSTEQRAARERIGLDKSYELIEEISITEEVAYIVRSVNLQKVMIRTECPAATAETLYVIVNYDGDATYYSLYCGNATNPNGVTYLTTFFGADQGLSYFLYCVSNQAKSNATSVGTQHNAVGLLVEKVTRIAFTNITFPIGSKIQIFGVKA